MCQRLYNFIVDILAMPHYANNNAGSGVKFNLHEDAIANELVKNGYTEVLLTTDKEGKPAKTFPKLTQKLLKAAIDSPNRQVEIGKLIPELQPGQFIRQPAGSQCFPDFLIRDISGKFVIIEAKSSKDNSLAWNDNLPKVDVIYIFSSGKYNKNTIFLGQDILDPAREKILTQAHDQVKQIIEQTEKLLPQTDDKLNRGFSYYARPKFQQLGGKIKTDYFEHADRSICESNVLTFALHQ
jgi:hypothetical protein